ncbi:CobW family GTP-binding protein [Planomonospora parontospora]|uniref:CobW family GTP-binding protein n=1 Tax=Planomonospora parontospora TaxID=58119 RepID=UPI0019869FE5|nr:GTP-binding protein [Planomonospora parontospora]GGL53766.1 cobalamin biosynthesis protein CobW [Planomonospora parontospora subsp. antibiotica]GII19627.1 cobalamin biosynthesis protein CobW [Planomonospora parontospora subsp. antibiotica]
MSTPVVLIAGLHAPARTAAVDRLLHDHPGAVAIHHDLREVVRERVERVVRDRSGILDLAEVRLAHGCVTCTVREDLLPELIRRAATASLLIVELWDAVEPRAVAEAVDCEEAHGVLRLTSVLTALDAVHMPIDITRGDRLAETGQVAAAGDQRFLAEVLARQIEYATGLVLHGGDTEDEELSRAVLDHLAPVTPVFGDDALPEVTGAALCTGMLAERIDPATARLPVDARTDEITTVVWHRLRPLHPARLFETVDELVTTSVRSRGRFWLATRPEQMLAWDAVAGVVSVEDAGPWLAALPQAAWEMVSPARRAAAALDWDEVTGDRVQHLVFTGPDLDPGHVHALLDSCLLTEEEMLAGSDAWAGYDDPFTGVLDLKETA